MVDPRALTVSFQRRFTISMRSHVGPHGAEPIGIRSWQSHALLFAENRCATLDATLVRHLAPGRIASASHHHSDLLIPLDDSPPSLMTTSKGFYDDANSLRDDISW